MNTRRSLTSLLASLLSAGLLFSSAALVFAEEDLPSRDIYVIYDDSGSMYYDYAQKKDVDTWSKAKYSMEVFASMLGPDDTMKIYYMLDYSGDQKDKGAKITIEGDKDSQENILTIREQKTASGDTPFETVEAAYDDLEESDGDEKWLIVLSDGQFRNGDKTEDEQKNRLNSFLENKNSDINVVFLGLGKDASQIQENKDKDIYSERAADASQILEKVTEVSNRVFNMNRLKEVGSDGSFTLDVPMSQITVFVQGDNPEVLSLVDENGNETGTLLSSVTVSTTEKSDNSKHPDNIPDEEMRGEVVVFDGDFAPGKYQVMTKNAAKTEIYYKPNLAVKAYLTNENGEQIDELKDLPTGDYILHFDLVNGLDGSRLPQKNIVAQSGDVDYEAIIKNNGQVIDEVYDDGDTIHVQEGNLDIDVTATFLRYNQVHDQITVSAFDEKNVIFDAEGPDEWTLKDNTLQAAAPMKLRMKVQGQTPDAAEWAQVQPPEITIDTGKSASINSPKVTKSDEPGVFLIEPDPDQTVFEKVPYEKADMIIVMDQEIVGIPWKGKQELNLKVRDGRSCFVKNGKWLAENWFWMLFMPFLLILLLIFAAIGYIPGVKKYLPKNISKKLNIECIPQNNYRERSKNEPSTFIVDQKSKWLPYVAQKAKFRIVPPGAEGADLPMMKVRALKNNKIQILNPGPFKDGNVMIDDEQITDETEKVGPIGKTTVIVTEGTDYAYEFSLSRKYQPDDSEYE